ncbi:LysM domain-containing protein [Acinetobacter sp. WCHAc060033]|uniref:LysM peptidoglycan-binding domain-containing protein n=1 Tax=Acinetobacter sp. WCHAc060033 TaxID=2518624 RepID=UPI001022A784|nr:LysM domain-containing protein [Acinetobacter sp. WCHAc060033]RZG87309.1 LysM domain-containing protein [Acinetobacter sp. WCHAc060033]
MISNDPIYYHVKFLFRNPWNKPIPQFYYMVKSQGKVILKSRTFPNGITEPIAVRQDQETEIYAIESWKEGSPEVYIDTLKSFDEIQKIIGKTPKVIPVDVPYLRFDNIKTVPNKAPSTGYKRKTYKVISGDTLEKISKQFGMKLSDILKINPQIKDKNVIKVGQIIKIPTQGK